MLFSIIYYVLNLPYWKVSTLIFLFLYFYLSLNVHASIVLFKHPFVFVLGQMLWAPFQKFLTIVCWSTVFNLFLMNNYRIFIYTKGLIVKGMQVFFLQNYSILTLEKTVYRRVLVKDTSC